MCRNPLSRGHVRGELVTIWSVSSLSPSLSPHYHHHLAHHGAALHTRHQLPRYDDEVHSTPSYLNYLNYPLLSQTTGEGKNQILLNPEFFVGDVNWRQILFKFLEPTKLFVDSLTDYFNNIQFS